MTTCSPVASAIRSFRGGGISFGQARSIQFACPLERRAFTLIELMVVVAIITLLIAVIIPSLAASRENVRSVLCRTNFTELSKAMLMYANAHGGFLPFEDRVKESMLPAEIYKERKGYACWYDAVDKYLKTDKTNVGVKLCPTIARDTPNSSEGYRMNSKLAETNWLSPYYLRPPFRKLDTLKSPLTTVLLFDGDVGGNVISFKGRWRLTRDDVDYRHNTKTNVVFAGGNIENLHKKVLAKKSIGNSPVIWQPADVGPWDPDPLNE